MKTLDVVLLAAIRHADQAARAARRHDASGDASAAETWRSRVVLHERRAIRRCAELTAAASMAPRGGR